jgi:hypothetical protein
MIETSLVEQRDGARVIAYFSVSCPRICLANKTNTLRFASLLKPLHACSLKMGRAVLHFPRSSIYFTKVKWEEKGIVQVQTAAPRTDVQSSQHTLLERLSQTT